MQVHTPNWWKIKLNHSFSRQNGVISALSIMGSSYQAERLEYRGLKIPVHERSNPFSQLGLGEMQLLSSSNHISQNAPIICTMNWEHVQPYERAELRCQLSEIHDSKLKSLFSKTETGSNVWFMTCLNFFSFHRITVTVCRKCRAVCIGCTWPVRRKCM